MRLEEIIGKRIKKVRDMLDGLEIRFDDGSKILLFQTSYPDGSFNETHIVSIR